MISLCSTVFSNYWKPLLKNLVLKPPHFNLTQLLSYTKYRLLT